MALNSISFTLASGGYGTPIPGSDYISGALIYNASAPSGMTLGTSKALFGITDAEAVGILADYNDETQATGNLAITLGTTGDKITLKVVEPLINGGTVTVNLGTYTVLSTDTTSTILATSLSAFINLGTPSHGYSATHSTTNVVLKARKSLGQSLNSGTPIVDTIVGTTAIVITQFTGGVASKQAIWHYQISEYFRLQPSGKLWLAFFAVPSTYDFTELHTMQKQTGGEINQFGVFSSNGTSTANITADLGAIQATCVTMFNEYMPAVVVYAPNIFAISDLSTLLNLRLNTDNYVSLVIGQDGTGLGAKLSFTSGSSVPAWGACLGTVSLAKVENDIANVGKFNISNGSEDAVPAFSNGSLYNSISTGLANQLDTFGYIFLRTITGKTGSYWNDSHSCIAVTSPYSYIERNRVINKAQRITYTALVPFENSDLNLNSDGTLTFSTINQFKSALIPSFNQMVANGEISAYKINIDPKQNVLANSTIAVNINIVGVGIARFINVTLGYSLSV